MAEMEVAVWAVPHCLSPASGLTMLWTVLTTAHATLAVCPPLDGEVTQGQIRAYRGATTCTSTTAVVPNQLHIELQPEDQRVSQCRITIALNAVMGK